MRRVLAAGVCLLGLTAPGLATDLTYSPPAKGAAFYQPVSTVQAHVDIYGGLVWFNGSGSSSVSEHAGLFGGAGRINVPFQNGWNLQMDAQASSLLAHEGSYSLSAPTEFSGYAHLYKMNPGSHAVGVFGGASWLLGPQAYTAGVEGQMYWQQFTAYGQASVSALKAGDYSGHAVQLRGQGQWFATPNTALMGDVIWTHINLDGSASVLTLAGTVMHRFADTPFAGFAKIRWDQFSSSSYTGSATTLLAGLRLIADPPGSTLQQSLQGVPMNVEPIQFSSYGYTSID